MYDQRTIQCDYPIYEARSTPRAHPKFMGCGSCSLSLHVLPASVFGLQRPVRRV